MFRPDNPDRSTLHGKIAERFRALWDVLQPVDDVGQNEFRSLMRDRIRDALDRSVHNISVNRQVEFIANSFAVEQVIAENEATQVLAVRHRDLGTQHVLKCAAVQVRADPIIRSLLLHEASIGLGLCDPHIVRTQMLLRLEDGRAAILMERCGPSLAQIAQSEPLSGNILRQVAQSLFAALHTLHEKGLVHGDISAANLLRDIDDPQRWKLCDLALCRGEGKPVPTSDIVRAGTTAFQSPEQAAGEAADRRSDLFSGGRLLKWLMSRLTQNTPISADLVQLISDLTKDNLESRPTDVSACLERLSS